MKIPRREFLRGLFAASVAPKKFPKPKWHHVPMEYEDKPRKLFGPSIDDLPLEPFTVEAWFRPGMDRRWLDDAWELPLDGCGTYHPLMVQGKWEEQVEKSKMLLDEKPHFVCIRWGKDGVVMTCDDVAVETLLGLRMERSPYEFYDEGTLSFEVQLRKLEDRWGEVVVFPNDNIAHTTDNMIITLTEGQYDRVLEFDENSWLEEDL